MRRTSILSASIAGVVLCMLMLGMFTAPLNAAPGQQAAATATPDIATTTTPTQLTTATTVVSPTVLATTLTTATTVVSPTVLATTTTTVTATVGLTPTTSAPSTLPSTSDGGSGSQVALLGIVGVALLLSALYMSFARRDSSKS